MKWDFRRLPRIHTENTDWHRCLGIRRIPRMNTDAHGCLGVNVGYANDSAGGVYLSFPKFSVGNLNYEEVRVYREAREEHEG